MMTKKSKRIIDRQHTNNEKQVAIHFITITNNTNKNSIIKNVKPITWQWKANI